MGQHPFDAEAAPFIERTLERLVRDLGPEATSAVFVDAFRRWPPHLFVERYTVAHRAWYETARGQPLPHLQRIYGVGPLTLRDDRRGGYFRPLSQIPSAAIAARFVQMLKLRPGDRVLEIGCGSGWVLALIAHIVGPEGRAVGVEIDADLAAQTRQRLARLGIANACVLTGDGAVALPDERFDRVAIAAGIHDLPRTVLGVMTDEALLVAPAGTPGRGWRLYGWTRRGSVLHVAASVSCVVPGLLGRLAVDEMPMPFEEDLPFADLLKSPPQRVAPCFADVATEVQRYEVQSHFSNFVSIRLGRTYDWLRRGTARGETRRYIGCYDRRSSSAATLGPEGFAGYGPDVAWKQLRGAWQEWLALGRPPQGQFMLDIHASDARPSESSSSWVHQNRDSVFVWRLR